MRLAVKPGGALVLTVPRTTALSDVESFLVKHATWIDRAVSKMRHLHPLPERGRKAYLARREAARAFVHERVAYWNRFYGFAHGRIAIKNTKTVWGSCSRKGNLNFSYSLLFLPRELADYVIVHELCHLQEHNHSRAFWNLVAKTQPLYLRLRRELKRYVL